MDWSFLTPAGITFGFALLASLFHYHKYFKRDIAFTVVIYSLLVFCIVYFVSFENNIGLGIGLLGILSLIRLRSTPENPIDIAYVFYAISIGLLNASIENLNTVLVVNGILLFLITVFTSDLIYRKNAVKVTVTFDDVESENLGDTEALTKRIEAKFGVTPLKMKVKRVDYLKDSMTVEFTYHAVMR